MLYKWWYSKIPECARRELIDSFDKRELTGGSSIDWVQNYFKEYTGQNSICLNSGTSALIAGLIAAGVKPDETVALSPIGWIATLQAILAVGAKPLFVDVKSDVPILDVKLLHNLNFGCVVPTHYNGRLVDLSSFSNLESFSKRPIIVSDACKAFLGSTKNLTPWNLSDVTCFSTGMISQVSTIYGGIACTSSDEIFERLILQKNHGCKFENEGPYLENYFDFSLNLKPSNLHFSLAIPQLEELKIRRKYLIQLYENYQNVLKEFYKFGLSLVPVDITKGEIPLLVDAMCDHRECLTTFLLKNNVETQRFHAPLNSSIIDGRIDTYNQDEFPNAHKFASQAFHFPSGIFRSELDSAYFEYFFKLLKEFYDV